MSFNYIFRWFKFTLKPPNSMAIGNFFSAIWDTSHWKFFVKFGLKTPYDISYDPFYFDILSIFGDSRDVRVICHRKMPSENRFFSMKERWGIKVSWGL